MERLLQTHDPSNLVPLGNGVMPTPVPDESALLDELHDPEGKQPNAEQAAIKAALQAGAKGLVVLSGGPGTGKTFLTRQLIHEWRKEGKALVIAATTGAAATRISRGAQTIHSAFNIPLEGMYLGSMRRYDAVFQRLKNAEVIIIDEMSMLSAPILNLVLFRLQQCGGYRDVPTMLQDKLIILVGDHAQVGGMCTSCHSHGPIANLLD
jgi:Cdc6-like AAA superfamily ATPase